MRLILTQPSIENVPVLPVPFSAFSGPGGVAETNGMNIWISKNRLSDPNLIVDELSHVLLANDMQLLDKAAAGDALASKGRSIENQQHIVAYSALIDAANKGKIALAPEALAEARTRLEAAIGDGSVVDVVKTRFPANVAQIRHIFRNAPGHVADTPTNRALLLEVANDASILLGPDAHGNQWFARLNANGSQTWVQVRNNLIINGGVNQTPKTYNPDTGLSG